MMVAPSTRSTMHPVCVQIAESPVKVPAVGWLITSSCSGTISALPTGTSAAGAIAPVDAPGAGPLAGGMPSAGVGAAVGAGVGVVVEQAAMPAVAAAAPPTSTVRRVRAEAIAVLRMRDRGAQ